MAETEKKDPLYDKARKYVNSEDDLAYTVKKSKDGDRDAQRNVEEKINTRDGARKDLIDAAKEE